jgi:hypothetical protein
MKLESVDNGHIEIQQTTHKPRNDTDTTQKSGELMALKSKLDECSKILMKPAEVRRKWPHRHGV